MSADFESKMELYRNAGAELHLSSDVTARIKDMEGRKMRRTQIGVKILFFNVLSIGIAAMIMVPLTAYGAKRVSQEAMNSEYEVRLVTEAETKPETEVEAETHLELVEFEDYTPIYVVSFQKIDGETGEVIAFEDDVELTDQTTTMSIDVDIEPYDAIYELGYWYSGTENMQDMITLQFWNKGEAESFLITIDGFTYEIAMPTAETEEITLNQALDVDGNTAQIDTAVIYPNVLQLKLSEVDSLYYQAVTLLEYQDTVYAPVRTCLLPDSEEMELLFLCKDGDIPRDGLKFKVKSGDEWVYFDLTLE